MRIVQMTRFDLVYTIAAGIVMGLLAYNGVVGAVHLLGELVGVGAHVTN